MKKTIALLSVIATLLFICVAIISYQTFFKETKVVIEPLPGARTMDPLWNITDLDPYIEVGNFISASSTILSILNPLVATSTIDLVILDNDNSATSSYSVYCATSSDAYTAITSANSNLIALSQVASSTNFYATNLGTAATDTHCGSGSVTYGTSVNNLVILPTEYFVCTVANNGSADLSITGGSTAFDGRYGVRFLELIN